VHKADSYPFREVRDVVASGGAQLVAKDILEDVLDGVPALMNALETLSKVHPFIASMNRRIPHIFDLRVDF
jgi:hypothetical protein